VRSISVLGATGSIGASTLDLIRRNREQWRVVALTANGNAAELAALAREFSAETAVVADEACLPTLRESLSGTATRAEAGSAALIEAAARPVDVTVAAIVGCAGLAPTMAAIGQGNTVALANKEALVSAGEVMTAAVARTGATLLPVDSEHNAIFQVLDARQADKISKLILTASGGPFFGRTRDQLRGVTVEQALKHPNWTMGAKITIDSATLANKGLELIEAAILFDMPPDRIDVVIHPQSVIHSLVEYADGSSLAQLGTPDMRVPISYCLGWPDRVAWDAPKLDLKKVGNLSFSEPDTEAFPMLRLAREALENDLCGVFNAANEVCVQAFLDKRIDFLQIAEFVEMAMMRAQLPSMASLRHASRDRTVDNMNIALDIDSGVRELVGGFVSDTRQGVQAS